MAAEDLFRTPDTVTPTPVVRPAAMNPAPHMKVNSSSDVPSASYQVTLLNWLTQALKEGESLLMQEGYMENVDENIKMVMGQYNELPSEVNKPSYLSNVVDSRIGKNINDIASAITDFRPTWHYKTYNPQYEHQGQILDKLSVAWWYTNAIDLKLQLLVKRSLVARTGYAYICYNPTLNNGLGDVDLIIKDYRDVIPIRPNSKITIQDAFGVIVRSRNTVNWAKARYPDYAARIMPTTEGALFRPAAAGGFRVNSPALDYLESQRNQRNGDFAIPLYDHYEIYLKDTSINSGSARVWIGPGPEDQHPWGYWVEPGKPLYPRGRLIICANLQVVMYDGGNPYWHGMFPVAKLTLDPYDWSFLGKSAIADAKSPQLAAIEIGQGVMNAARKAINPGIFADKNAVSREQLNRLDTRQAGFKVKTNPSVGSGIILEQPLPLPPYVMDLKQQYEQKVDYVMGVLDMRALEQIRSLSGNVDVEAMLEHLGPSIRTRGRVLEVFMREIGTMMLSNFFQFWNIGRRIQILGQDGIDFEDYDYDPGSLVPASTDGVAPGEASRFFNEQPGEFGGTTYAPKSRADRAYEHCKSFVFFLTPNSLLNMSKKQDQMMYLQLFGAGVIDPVTLLEKLDVPNIGELPGNPQTIMERMQASQGAGFTGAISPQGRKASNETPARTVIKTSK